MPLSDTWYGRIIVLIAAGFIGGYVVGERLNSSRRRVPDKLECTFTDITPPAPELPSISYLNEEGIDFFEHFEVAADLWRYDNDQTNHAERLANLWTARLELWHCQRILDMFAHLEVCGMEANYLNLAGERRTQTEKLFHEVSLRYYLLQMHEQCINVKNAVRRGEEDYAVYQAHRLHRTLVRIGYYQTRAAEHNSDEAKSPEYFEWLTEFRRGLEEAARADNALVALGNWMDPQ